MDDSLRQRARAARAGVQSGALRGGRLLALLQAVPFLDRDAFTDELLGFDGVPPDIADLPRGAVPYVPCGVDEILALVREAPVGPDDELVDLGAGLGRVAILAHLLAGARTRGVELQQPLVRAARDRCAALGLTEVSFVHADAAEVELHGSIFFLYAPCNGQMLAAVLRRVEEVARGRRVVVCAVGLELAEVRWLRPRAPESSESSVGALALYDSVPPGADASRAQACRSTVAGGE